MHIIDVDVCAKQSGEQNMIINPWLRFIRAKIYKSRATGKRHLFG